MKMTPRSSLVAVVVCLVLAATVSCCLGQQRSAEQTAASFFKRGNHTNNWAVLVSTSRFWFNYRHAANALSFYRTLKRMGLGDDRIIVMLADDMACDARNSVPGTIFNNADHRINLYGDNIEVDYRGYEATVENFIRLLTDRHDPATPRNKRLLSDSGSNILIFMTGHGGNEFIKFQDAEEISSQDIADSIEQMHRKNRYNEILFMADTCQAATLFNRFYSPNVLSIGSSMKSENSYAYTADDEVGVSVIDRFTYATLDFFERRLTPDSTATIHDLFSSYNPSFLGSNALWSTTNYKRPLNQVYLTEFFGAVNPVALSPGNWLNLNISMDEQVPSHSHKSQESETTSTDASAQPIEPTDFIVAFNPAMVTFVGAGVLVLLLVLSFIF